MPKQKRDWNKLKMEYMLAEEDEVKAFFLHKYNIYNRQHVGNSKGRSKEKRIYKEKIIEKALEKQQDKDAEKLSLSLSYLAQAKNDIVKKLIAKLQNEDRLSISDFTKGIESVRTEMGLPTRYSKNENEEHIKGDDIININFKINKGEKN